MSLEGTPVSQAVFTVFLGLGMGGGELRDHMKNPGVNYDTYDQDADPRDTEDPDLFAKLGFGLHSPSLTYERYTGNTDGATSAWSWDPRQRFYEKGLLDLVVDTPVRNLLVGSCWANQTGGIPGAIAAAYRCTQKIK